MDSETLRLLKYISDGHGTSKELLDIHFEWEPSLNPGGFEKENSSAKWLSDRKIFTLTNLNYINTTHSHAYPVFQITHKGEDFLQKERALEKPPEKPFFQKLKEEIERTAIGKITAFLFFLVGLLAWYVVYHMLHKFP